MTLASLIATGLVCAALLIFEAIQRIRATVEVCAWRTDL
jgi:hypothetical protein